MIFDLYAADLGEALVDPQVPAVWRQASEADRRGVIDELQCGLLRKKQYR
jgi:hypothetical protein